MKFFKNFNNFFLEFSLFGIYGIISNLVSFSFYYAYIEILNLKYISSYFYSTSMILVINFFVYLKIFKALYNFNKAMKYIFTQFIFFISHLILIIFLVEYLHLNNIYSHLFSNVLLAIIIFFVYKFFVFKVKK